MRQDIDRSVCEHHVLEWAPELPGSQGLSHEVRYLSINRNGTCKMGMHLREEPRGGPVSARVGGQPVCADWFVLVSFLMCFGT